MVSRFNCKLLKSKLKREMIWLDILVIICGQTQFVSDIASQNTYLCYTGNIVLSGMLLSNRQTTNRTFSCWHNRLPTLNTKWNCPTIFNIFISWSPLVTRITVDRIPNYTWHITRSETWKCKASLLPILQLYVHFIWIQYYSLLTLYNMPCQTIDLINRRLLLSYFQYVTSCFVDADI